MFARIREWARSHTRRRVYSPVGVAFHWSVAALIVFQLWWGWRTGHLPVGADKLRAYEIHADVGLLILLVTFARMLWRMAIPGPVNDADKKGWQSAAAHLTHVTFYVCLLGLPLSGWAMLSATAPDQELAVAGLAPWPMLPFQDLLPPLRWAIEAWAEQTHWLFVLALLVLVPLHVGAALKHEIMDEDDVLRGMLPGLGRVKQGLRRIGQAAQSRKASGAS